MSKPKKPTSLADMSLPPEDRRRRRKPGVIATPPAQMDHGTSPRAKRQRRDGERWLASLPHVTPFETGEPWRGPAEREWDDSRD